MCVRLAGKRAGGDVFARRAQLLRNPLKTHAKKCVEHLPPPLYVTPVTRFSVSFVCKASSLFAANAKVWELA